VVLLEAQIRAMKKEIDELSILKLGVKSGESVKY